MSKGLPNDDAIFHAFIVTIYVKDKFSNEGSDKGTNRISCFLFDAGVHAHYLAEEYSPPCLKLCNN